MEQNNKLKLIAAIIIAGLLLIGLQQNSQEKSSVIPVQINAAENAEDSISQPEIVKNEIVVHVAGEVENPGVYTLTEGQRVEDALQKAGLTDQADADALNRAALLNDGQKIVVPFTDEAHTINQQEISSENSLSTTEQNHKINLNQATITQLMDLPGIGEVKAGAIIQYRQEHGGFQSVEELLQVSGIGRAIYAQVADSVYV